MEKQRDLGIIPVQCIGSQMDVVEKRIFKDEAVARVKFGGIKERLLDVNNWGKYAGISAFRLMDTHGIRAERLAIKTDFIRIDIPGPGTHAGMGYDWVLIEDIEEIESEQERILYMRVRPCPHPLSGTHETAHFLKQDATSTFIVRQLGSYIYAEEHGRNEMPNIADGSFYDKGRNFVVGMAAKFGLSYPQWKSLVKGLLAD
ncbi:hypothetical protein ACFOG5_22700 [Pedobacter fastidiosus]|uniref:Uncharacterized protein n=1 Tax=Pedobacter fastidiosus TaxID=2765361 RepID=A0ABR7KTP2_9SPHI|nr:hypothetical protein [Pedobacter fastidiosus]MBC6111406.1 hypothetical protein [Pedobacter fastidiosus]